MPAKSEPPFPVVEVSVVVLTDDQGRALLDYNHEWGVFTFPLSKRREPSAGGDGAKTTAETPLDAAVRAAAEVIGRPFDPAALAPQDVQAEPYHRSGRDGKVKRYTYRVYRMAAPADPRPVPGHSAVWATPAELRALAPISPTVANVLNAMPL